MPMEDKLTFAGLLGYAHLAMSKPVVLQVASRCDKLIAVKRVQQEDVWNRLEARTAIYERTRKQNV